MQQRNEAHDFDSNNRQPLHATQRPHRSPKWMVGAIAGVLCIIGATALGMVLTLPGNTGDGNVHTVSLKNTVLAEVTDRVPGELRVLVDMNGKEAPEGSVSPEVAVSVACDAAERYLGKHPIGRVQVFYGEDERYDPGYDVPTDPASWGITMETEDGDVEAEVDVLTGEVWHAHVNRSFSERYEGTWLERFDEWERTGTSPYQENRELWEAAEAAGLFGDQTVPELTNEDRMAMIEVKQMNLDRLEEDAATHADDPALEAAMTIVEDAGLGKEAKGLSATWMSDGVWYYSTSAVDVTLDNGEHIYCFMRGKGPYELVAFERRPHSWADHMYGIEIASLKAGME